MNKIYCGIDNGITGAVVFIDENEKIIAKYRGEDYTFSGPKTKTEFNLKEMRDILSQFDITDVKLVVLEKAQSMPMQGISSTFNYARGYGLWEGIISTLGLKYQLVHPKTWMKEILKDIDKTDTKVATGLFSTRNAPTEDFKSTPRCSKLHSGLCDAYCMAVYAKRLLKK